VVVEHYVSLQLHLNIEQC